MAAEQGAAKGVTGIPTGSGLEGFLDALHIAIRMEEEGLQFYTLNAQRMRNPRGRAVLNILVRDERLHLGKLRAQLAGIQEAVRGTPDEERVGRSPVRDLTHNPVFSRGRTLTDRDADELEVLRQGIAIEWDAYNFYRARGETAADPWSKLIYDDLALEEKQHYEALVEAYETIVRGTRSSYQG